MASDLDGKVALITGGSNGIGEGVARHLAGRGVHVVLADIDVARGKALADELDGRFVQTDVADPAASTAAVATAVDVFGGLHIAHLNAGVTSWCGMGDDFDPEAYRRSMAINLDGVVYGIAAARPAIKASGGGTIVATASMAGLVATLFDPIYAANKHAVVGLARSLGQVYEPHPFNEEFGKLLPSSTELPTSANYSVWVQGIEEATGTLAQTPSTTGAQALAQMKSFVTNQLGPSAVTSLP